MVQRVDGGPRVTRVTSSRLINARRDAVVLTVLITAVMLLIWNGSAFFHSLRIGEAGVRA